MLKRLSLKFTVVGVAALFCVELLMTLLINGLNFYYNVSEADEAVQIILDNKGKFPEHFKPNRPRNAAAPDLNRRDSEMRYITRYFTVMFNADGKVDRIDTGNIASVTSEQAERYACDVLSCEEDMQPGGYVKGFYDGYNFRYAVKENPNGEKMIVFYDFGEKLRTLLNMMEISGAIAVILLVIFSVMILLFSKRAVRPVMESIEKQRRFITDAGHELKTPLAIIRADTEVIEMTGGENEWTKSIVNQTDRLNELLSQMLMLTKSQEAVQTSFREFDLSQAVKDTADGFEPLFSSQNKPLDVQVTPDITVNGDSQMLCTLLSVLLKNAANYSSEKSVVEVRLTSGGSKAVLSVSNLCDEPPQGDPNLLFERFYRADSSRTRETGGSGIGLSIAKSIAESHKAKIGCAVDGKRITFTLKIPI